MNNMNLYDTETTGRCKKAENWFGEKRVLQSCKNKQIPYF